MAYRELTIAKAENGYIVSYQLKVPNQEANEPDEFYGSWKFSQFVFTEKTGALEHISVLLDT